MADAETLGGLTVIRTAGTSAAADAEAAGAWMVETMTRLGAGALAVALAGTARIVWWKGGNSPKAA